MVKPVNAMQRVQILGAILAGGQSSRMGVEKALMPLRDRPVLAHVIARFQPQVARLVLNGNGDAARFARFGLQVLADAPAFAGQGPLAGLAAAIAIAAQGGFSHLACVPCDAPFLPVDLVARLSAVAGNDIIAMATGPRGDEPLFALWPVGLLPEIANSLVGGRRGVHDLVTSLPHRRVNFAPDDFAPDPFLNLNRPQDAQLARNLLAKPAARSDL